MGIRSWKERSILHWHECREKVRFHEVDAYDVVWHGHYIAYFEIGRLALSGRFSLSPEELGAKGYFAPVVDLGCRYREPARYGDELIVRTSVAPADKAALTFRYQLLRASDDTLLAEGFTTHVLLSLEGRMIYLVPDELRENLDEMMAFCHA